jgi:hypothetical protein
MRDCTRHCGTEQGVVQIQLHEIRSDASLDEFRRESRR